jgi:predicted nuclease with TOPRIM domain
MAVRKTKWYANKWTYIIGIILVVISYFVFTEGPEYFNLNSYLKEIIKEKDEQIKEKDAALLEKEKEIKKIKETRSKISTEETTNKIKRLEAELRLLQEAEKRGVDYREVNPTELKNYFNNIINKK